MSTRNSLSGKITILPVLILANLFAFTSPVSSQELIITNARVIDGTGAEPVDGVNIIIDGGRVMKVTTDTVNTEGASVIDAKGLTVMPGLVDAHSHSMTDGTAVGYPSIVKYSFQKDGDVEEFVKTTLPARFQNYLESGVTTIVDMGAYWPHIAKIREQVRAGDIPGPRMFIVGPAFSSPIGHPAATICGRKPWCIGSLSVSTDDPMTARKAVRKLADGGVDGIKIVYGGNGEIGGAKDNRLKKDVLYAVVDEAHKLGLPVIAHATSSEEATTVVAAGVDGLAHSPRMENAEFTNAAGESMPMLLNRYNISVTTTDRFAMRPLRYELTEEQLAGVKDDIAQIAPTLHHLQSAGVKIVFGTDFAGLWREPREYLRQQFKVLIDAGFSEMEVIKMATGNASSHPMVPDEVGTIQSGRFADMIFLQSDPLGNIDAVLNPLIVIKAGHVVVDHR